MRISPRTDEVRTLVRKILTDLGGTNHEIDQLTTWPENGLLDRNEPYNARLQSEPRRMAA